MTYIDAMNRLWELSMTYSSKDFTLSDYAVMCGILQIWNSIKRPMKFNLDYNVMMHGTKASINTYYKSLKRLENLGMFKYQSGSNQYCFGEIDLSQSALSHLRKQSESDGKAVLKQSESDANIITEYREESKEEREKKKEFLSSSSSSRARDNDNGQKKNGNTDLSVVQNAGTPVNSPPVAAAPPSFEEVAEYMEKLGLYKGQAMKEAIKFVNKNVGSGWRFKKGAMIYDWKSVANSWIVQIENHEQNNQNGAVQHGIAPQYTSDEELDKLYG